MSALAKSAPGAERILAAYQAAQSAAESAVQKALVCGQLLIEQKAAVGHGEWLPWLSEHCPEISHDTAGRWMNLAERVITIALPRRPLLALPMSAVLTSQPDKLDDKAREVRQLLFDFVENKTIRQCMSEVVVGGDEPHRLTRAANGRQHGGYNGEDRKAFEIFVAKGLDRITTHLGHKLSKTQQTAVEAAFTKAVAAWPRWLCELLADAARQELKLSDAERAARRS